MFRVGMGFDVHQFVTNKPCVIGGVVFDHSHGLLGHSDADVLLHAIADALLGALALGDLGDHFPDTDPKWKDADSKVLLQECYRLVWEKGFEIVNLDTVVVCEAPKIKKHRSQIQETVSSLLNVKSDCVSIKATTEEKMGYTGSGEGIKAFAYVLVKQRNESC